MHVWHGRQREAWAGVCAWLAAAHGGGASNHVSKPSEQPWAALFITQQHSLLRPGACLPPSVLPPKQIRCISEQTARCTEMLPALLPFPLRKWWVDPSQLLQPCSSSANTQKSNSQRKLACFFTLHFHLISLFNATYRKKKKSIKGGVSLSENPNRNASEPFGNLAGVFKRVTPRFRPNL